LPSRAAVVACRGTGKPTCIVAIPPASAMPSEAEASVP
jgi:hypothetical protein